MWQFEGRFAKQKKTLFILTIEEHVLIGLKLLACCSIRSGVKYNINNAYPTVSVKVQSAFEQFAK